jgi:hypothetical protein
MTDREEPPGNKAVAGAYAFSPGRKDFKDLLDYNKKAS